MKSYALSLLALFSSTALAADPGYIGKFQIITSVRANQSASAAKYDKLLLQGGQYGGPARTNTARLVNESWDYFYYNGTNIASLDGGIGGMSFVGGLKLRDPESSRELWTPVTATIWMTDDGRPHREYFKVVPNQPIVWTDPAGRSGYGVNWQGWLACTWAMKVPQLFYYSIDVKDWSIFPEDCAVVDLYPVITNATKISEKPPVDTPTSK